MRRFYGAIRTEKPISKDLKKEIGTKIKGLPYLGPDGNSVDFSECYGDVDETELVAVTKAVIESGNKILSGEFVEFGGEEDVKYIFNRADDTWSMFCKGFLCDMDTDDIRGEVWRRFREDETGPKNTVVTESEDGMPKFEDMLPERAVLEWCVFDGASNIVDVVCAASAKEACAIVAGRLGIAEPLEAERHVSSMLTMYDGTAFRIEAATFSDPAAHSLGVQIKFPDGNIQTIECKPE